MIVRISGEDQYRLDPPLDARLKVLDEEVLEAVDRCDEQRYHDSLKTLLELVRSEGQVLGDDELEGSDLILPPEDLSLSEARREFTGEGLIPE